MNPMNQGPQGINVDARYRTLLILWFAILMSVGIFFFITLLIERPPADSNNNTLLWVFMALSIFPLIFSFLLKGRLLAQSVREQRPDLVQSALILSVALCEVVSLFGLMVFFTTRTPYYYLFFIVSVVGILLHLPRRDQLLAASYKGQGLE
jgi:O-antigen/teichoic acid export membrane protein